MATLPLLPALRVIALGGGARNRRARRRLTALEVALEAVDLLLETLSQQAGRQAEDRRDGQRQVVLGKIVNVGQRLGLRDYRQYIGRRRAGRRSGLRGS